MNLESGNFTPPHLTMIDDIVDVKSDILGAQIFEKAVSGMYLGEIVKAVFPDTEFENKFDAQKLTQIISYPDIHKVEYVKVATNIYIRSAYLVAASLPGLIKELKEQSPSIKKICITAEGSLFWSENRKGENYKEIVSKELYLLLDSLGYTDLTIEINRIENANLIGAAYAAFG